MSSFVPSSIKETGLSTRGRMTFYCAIAFITHATGRTFHLMAFAIFSPAALNVTTHLTRHYIMKAEIPDMTGRNGAPSADFILSMISE